MPTYRYRCDTDGEEFEVWQSIQDDALTVHEGCGGTLRKVLSPAGIVLKGAGFYKNDSRNGGKRSSAGTKERDSKESKESKDSKGSKDSPGSSSGDAAAASTSSSSSGSGSSGSGSSSD